MQNSTDEKRPDFSITEIQQNQIVVVVFLFLFFLSFFFFFFFFFFIYILSTVKVPVVTGHAIVHYADLFFYRGLATNGFPAPLAASRTLVGHIGRQEYLTTMISRLRLATRIGKCLLYYSTILLKCFVNLIVCI